MDKDLQLMQAELMRARLQFDGAFSDIDDLNTDMINLQNQINVVETTANNAQTTATAAQTAVNAAQTAATDAHDLAADAVADAATAQTTANNAQTTATAAQTAANAAQTAVNAAQTAATDAHDLAVDAVADAATAQTTANNAQTTATAAQTAANAAQTTAVAAASAAAAADTKAESAIDLASLKYEKPTAGIPESDLSQAVQTKLNAGGSLMRAVHYVKVSYGSNYSFNFMIIDEYLANYGSIETLITKIFEFYGGVCFIPVTGIVRDPASEQRNFTTTMRVVNNSELRLYYYESADDAEKNIIITNTDEAQLVEVYKVI